MIEPTSQIGVEHAILIIIISGGMIISAFIINENTKYKNLFLVPIGIGIILFSIILITGHEKGSEYMILVKEYEDYEINLVNSLPCNELGDLILSGTLNKSKSIDRADRVWEIKC